MRQTVFIRPEVLVWARRSCGLSPKRAADLLDVTVETLALWEKEGQAFTISALRELGQKYKRPIVALVQSTVPPLPEPPEDFRTFGGRPPELGALTLLTIRDTKRIQDIASEIVMQDKSLFPALSIPQADWKAENASELALFERQSLGITIQEQLHWSSANEAFNAWRTRIQLRGVLVLVKAMDAKDCRGFSLYEHGKMPVIVANQKEIDQAKIFTLCHEYAHLLLRREGVCLEQGGNKTEREKIEAWCNAFAGTLIAPESEVRAALRGQTIDAELVGTLARKFNVSRPVIAIRLRNEGLVDDAFVKQFTANAEEIWRQKPIIEEDETTEEDDGFRRRQEDIRLSEVGFAYAKIVLGALHNEFVTVREACDYLNVRAEVLEPLEGRARSFEARHA